MENRITKLKNDFNNLIIIRNNVKIVFDILQTRINKLKFFYSEFIKNNKNKLFVFGLDSFHFQSKLIDIEYDDMKRLFLAINNRMYCEYFKLYKIITEYVYDNISDKKITEIIKLNNFPTYKDLEPYKEYNFELVADIHENILIIIGSIISNLNTKENELNIYKTKMEIGLNIDNFITSFNYELIVMKEKIQMFLTYTEFFHELHTKYLRRFNNKIQLLYTHISNDIKFDETVEVNKDDIKDKMDNILNEININESTIFQDKETQNTKNNNSQINNILYNSNNADNIKLVNEILESNNKNNKNNKVHKGSMKETIKNGMSKFSTFLKSRSSKDSKDYNIDSSIHDNFILENFKVISESFDSILDIKSSDNTKIENSNSLDISDFSTNDTLCSIRKESVNELLNELVKEDFKEETRETNEELKEDFKEESRETNEQDNNVVNEIVSEIVNEIVNEIENETIEDIKEVDQNVTNDESFDEIKKKRTYKPRKKKKN